MSKSEFHINICSTGDCHSNKTWQRWCAIQYICPPYFNYIFINIVRIEKSNNPSRAKTKKRLTEHFSPIRCLVGGGTLYGSNTIFYIYVVKRNKVKPIL